MVAVMVEVPGVVFPHRTDSSKPRVCSSERPSLPTSMTILGDVYIHAQCSWHTTTPGPLALWGSAPQNRAGDVSIVNPLHLVTQFTMRVCGLLGRRGRLSNSPQAGAWD